MYRFGHDLLEFAMYPLLARPEALAEPTGMYRRYLETDGMIFRCGRALVAAGSRFYK